jgi:hypothetical protein
MLRHLVLAVGEVVVVVLGLVLRGSGL